MQQAEGREALRKGQAEERPGLPQGQPVLVGQESEQVPAEQGQDEVREEELKKGSGKCLKNVSFNHCLSSVLCPPLCSPCWPLVRRDVRPLLHPLNALPGPAAEPAHRQDAVREVEGRQELIMNHTVPPEPSTILLLTLPPPPLAPSRQPPRVLPRRPGTHRPHTHRPRLTTFPHYYRVHTPGQIRRPGRGGRGSYTLQPSY